MKLKIISGEEVNQAVTMAEAIEAVKKSFIQLSEGKAEIPLRSSVEVKENKGVCLFMPAYLAESNALGMKIVTVFPENQKKNLPTVLAAVFVLDSETGQPLAMIEGSSLTALRTGAASGVATDLLAREEARVVAIFGAGQQAYTQLEAVCTVRSIQKVLVYDIIREKSETFVKEMKSRGAPIPSDMAAADSPSQALSETDIICTATTSHQPLFADEDLQAGVHINGIGSYTPEMAEIPPQTVVRSKVIVDSFQASLAEAGDLIIPIEKGLISREDIHGEIGEVASGKIAGRETDKELTFFKSVGVAVQDVATAALILRRCQALGLGCSVDI